jgi:CDGSH-type Zn-finger protein
MAEAKPGAKPSISMSATGPLLVKGLQHLRNSKGERLETRPTLALCRCGGSANKPFCDGTHNRIGFKGASSPERSQDRVDRYEGRELTVLDNRFLCAHVGACSDGLAAAFKYGEEPWIDPNGGPSAKLREVIQRCPSGALAYALGGREVREFEREPGITVSQNGPYFVVGGIALETDAWAQGASREHYALCRCGRSKNKPFCDGSHWEPAFVDEKN